MTNYFLPKGTSPDYIIGKWDQLGDNLFTPYNDLRVNKYEFWFSSTISFMPYGGESVFTTDSAGNVTHSGNLLTKGSAIINNTLTVKNNIIAENNIGVSGNVSVTKDLKTDANLYVAGTIFSAYLNNLIAGLNSRIDVLSADVTALKNK
jgi:hypothetical protein